MKRAMVISSLALAAVSFASPPAAHPEPPSGAHGSHAATPKPQPADSHAAAPAAHEPVAPSLPPAEAMGRLIDGNDRFRHGESAFPRLDDARRSETFTGGQAPFAAVLACADSRVPVEAIFDQGIGDLFVVRIAGNVADVDEIGTLEYGVGHLGTGLIVVLGHTKCGAVTAVAEGAEVHGHVARLVDNIGPAVAAVKQRDPDAHGQRLIRLSIRANVLQSMQDVLTGSPLISAAVADGRVQVVGGVYDLQTGAIEWLGQHPRQAEFLSAAPETHAPTPSSPAHEHHPEPAAPAEKPKGHSDATKAIRKDNWLALGGLLAVSSVASFATIHKIYGRKAG